MSKLRGQDVMLVTHLLNQSAGWSFQSLADSVGMSASQCHSAIGRLIDVRLVDRVRRVPVRSNLLEFLRHGAKYMFPVAFGPEGSGVPTAHSAPVWRGRLLSPGGGDFVWAHPQGSLVGTTVPPLYKSVPLVAMQDENTYAILAVVDSIRLGKAREIREAEELLERLVYGRD